MSMIHKFERSFGVKTCVKCESFPFFLFVTFRHTSFQGLGVNLLVKICPQKNKGAPFCFLPRAPQTLVTLLSKNRVCTNIKHNRYLHLTSNFRSICTINLYSKLESIQPIQFRCILHLTRQKVNNRVQLSVLTIACN